MTTGCYETSLLLFANARGVGTLLTTKCPAPGTHRVSNTRTLPGEGMLAVGIDSHITQLKATANKFNNKMLSITAYKIDPVKPRHIFYW